MVGGGAGFWNAMRVYPPEESLGVVLKGNTTSYDHEFIIATPWLACRGSEYVR